MAVEVLHGDCIEMMRTLEPDSVDSIVTDPPAGISFMSRAWDGDKGGRDYWIAWMQEVAAEALRVCKPGSHALVWALPRTSHWTATAWENAGWTVRDRVAHIFGSGFPKSLDISKAIDRAAGAEREVVGTRRDVNRGGGVKTYDDDAFVWPEEIPVTTPATDAARQWADWGTALKPAMEDWWLFRAPLTEHTVAAQVLATGTGALNVDGCRVETGETDDARRIRHTTASMGFGGSKVPFSSGGAIGRWPPNLLHDGSDEVFEAFARFGERRGGNHPANRAGLGSERTLPSTSKGTRGEHRSTDSGTAARFFPALGFDGDELRFMYCPKAPKSERAGSKHPTVKPLKLIRWLARLITPPDGTVLDPFAGSGTTGEAAMLEGFRAILIEQDEEYLADIYVRLDRARSSAPSPDLFTAA